MEEATATSNAGGRVRRTLFLSYSGKDRVLAEQVREILMKDGHVVWMAPHSIPPGYSYAAGIVEGINQAEIVFVLMTRNSNASPMVEREIERAVGKRKRLISLRADQFAPKGALEYFLSNVQWIDLVEADPALWGAALVAAAQNPDETAPPPSRAGVIPLTSSNALVFAGGLAVVAALIANFFNLTSAFPGALLLAGVALALGGWAWARRDQRVRRIGTLRWGDVAVIAGLTAGAAAAWFWLLITPLAAMIVLALLYLLLRSRPEVFGKELWRRGAVVAAVGLAVLGASVTWAEVTLYSALQPTRVTLALIPKNVCQLHDECEHAPQEIYATVHELLSDAFANSGVSIYPFTLPSEDEYEHFTTQLESQPRARGIALLQAIALGRDVFDAVLDVQINYQQAVCGSDHAALDLEVDLNDWSRGDWPTRAFWETRPDTRWRRFEATVDLNERNAPLLAVATASLAARVLLAAQDNPARLGGAETFDRALYRLLQAFDDQVGVLPPEGPHSSEALAALDSARSADAPRERRLNALQLIADAYAPMLRRQRGECRLETDVLASRVGRATAEAPGQDSEQPAPPTPAEDGG